MLTDFHNSFAVRISKKFATKLSNISPLILNVSFHYLEKFKCSVICSLRC